MADAARLKVDGGIPNQLARVAEAAGGLEQQGYDGEWDAMGSLIDDEMLDAFAVVGPVDEVGAAPRSRCEGVVDRFRPILLGASDAVRQTCVAGAMKEFRR